MTVTHAKPMFCLVRASADRSVGVTSMSTFHTRAAVKPGHRLEIADVPFAEGEEVEVLVVHHPQETVENGHPLRDTPVRYEHPTDPVAEADWDTLRRSCSIHTCGSGGYMAIRIFLTRLLVGWLLPKARTTGLASA